MREDNSGYITVEATYVMIIVLWCTFFIIMSAFYLSDQNGLRVRLHGLALSLQREYEMNRDYDSMNWRAWEEMGMTELFMEKEYAASADEFIQVTDRECFFVSIKDCEARVAGGRLTVRYEGSWSCPLQLWLFGCREFKLLDEITYSILDAPEYLRAVNGAIKGLGG